MCGGIVNVTVKMASHNSRVNTTAELMSLFTTYVQNTRKRPNKTDAPTVQASERLDCHFDPYVLTLGGIGNGKLHIFAKLTIPAKFDDVCLGIEFYVTKDKEFSYDCLIGRNIIEEYSNITVVIDSLGCRITSNETSAEKTH